MPLGQRLADMPPKRRLRIRDLGGELLISATDALKGTALRLAFSRGKQAMCPPLESGPYPPPPGQRGPNQLGKGKGGGCGSASF